MTQYDPRPAQPMNYASPFNPNNRPPKKGFFTWLVIILVLILLFVLMGNAHGVYVPIPLSDFRKQLMADQIAQVTIEGDDIRGTFGTSAPKPGSMFKTSVPAGTSANWAYTNWILENAGHASVTVDNNTSNLVTILVPLIPWLLIFGFIWFFVLRKVRGAGRVQGVVIQ